MTISFDYWLNWYATTYCNLKCEFCLIKDEGHFDCNPKIDHLKLLKTLSSFNKPFLITFSGGEPFLIPNIVESMKEVAKEHFISINTNLICDNIKEFVKEVNPNKVRDIFAAFHIKELVKHNLIEKYINNFNLCRNAGFNIKASAVAYPPLLPQANKSRELLKKQNINLEFDPFFGEFNGKEYPKSYTDEEMKVFQMDESKKEKFYHFEKMCNAGKNAGMVFPDGTVFACSGVCIKIGNVYEKIVFKDNLIKCPNKKCGCPFYLYEPELFKKA
jgi:organic radical activating enzyme